MNPNKKVLITVLSFVLAMLVIACSCSSLIPTISPQSNTGEAMPGLAGAWQDPETNFVFTVTWSGNSYHVAAVDDQGAAVTVSSQSWDGSTLTWSITDPTDSYTLSYETLSLSGDSLDTNWWASDGASGTETLKRVR